MTRHPIFRILVLALTAVSATNAEPLSRSFELRLVRQTPKANGVTDFKGGNTVLSTNERIAFLRDWAEYGSRFFGDPRNDTMVVKPGEAETLLERIKPQPVPAVRKFVPLEKWHWCAARPVRKIPESWTQAAGATLPGAFLRLDGTDGEVRTGAAVPAMENPRRMQATLRARAPRNSGAPLLVRMLGGGEKPASAEIAALVLDPAKTRALSDGRWHAVQFDLDFAAGRYNTKLDGAWIDYDRAMPSGHPDSLSGLSLSTRGRYDIDDVRVATILRHPDDGDHPIEPRIVLFEDFQGGLDLTRWAQPDTPTDSWDTARLPFAIGGREYAGKDLLLCTDVDLPAIPPRVFLRLETLTPGGEVWVNGRPVEVANDRTPRKIDITAHLHPGKNRIALRVDNYTNPDPMHHAPLDPNIGWFAGRARLELANAVTVERCVAKTTAIEGAAANTRHQISFRNETKEHFFGTVRLALSPWFPEEAGPVAEISRSIHIRPNRGAEVSLDLAIPEARLWSPEHPNLYQIRVTLLDKSGKPVDDWAGTTGLRTVDQKGGFFRLNGKPTGLHGAQIMGYRMPLLDMAKQVRCAPARVLATELLQTKRCGGNYLRLHVHATKSTADGVNDPRIAEMADQLGVMLSWQTPAWLRAGSPSGVDIARWPAYAREVINHPSIVVWELGNHPNRFSVNGDKKEETRAFVDETMSAVLAVDDTRLVTPTTFWKHTYYTGKSRSDEPDASPLYAHPLCTRGLQDPPTGYGRLWKLLRIWPTGYTKEWLEDPDFAYFNWEQQESIAQPNWNLCKNTPWHHIFSYERNYDKGSIGRNLNAAEWRESQAWQAFSAWESMKKMRQFGVSGFSWCCLHGGPNTGAYKKPVLDDLGYAKLAYWSNKMVFQPTVAGSWDVDTVYGPGDAIVPTIVHLGPAITADLSVTIRSLDGKPLLERSYKNISLPAGRKTVKLPPIPAAGLPEGTVAVEYELTKDV